MLILTCITAENQHVFPTFFNPTGQSPFRFLSCGFKGSCHTSPRFRLVPTAFDSARLASTTLLQNILNLEN